MRTVGIQPWHYLSADETSVGGLRWDTLIFFHAKGNENSSLM